MARIYTCPCQAFGRRGFTIMKNLSISDEKEGIYLYSGMVLAESDIDPLERIVSRLRSKIDKLEKHAPAPEGTRLNVLECSLVTLWKSHRKANKILEVLRNDVLALSHRLDLNRASRMRTQEEIDRTTKVIDRMDDAFLQEIDRIKKAFDKIMVSLSLGDLAGIERDKRLSDIEEFIGDL